MDEHTRQTIIELLQNSEPIPAEYESELFPTIKKEYELKYAGKEREEVILNNTMSVPFQEIKHFGHVEPDEWANMLIFGDNLQALKHLLKLKEEGKLKNSDGTDGVKLVYIDPPFATKQDFRGNLEQKAYQDKIIGSRFIEHLRKRLVLIKKLISENGSIYVHLDYKKSHYIKIVLDEIFGENNFLNNIVWCYRTRQFSKKYWNRKHEDILLYKKGNDYTFNWDVEGVIESYSENTIKKYKLKDQNGYYRLCGRGLSGSPIKSAKDVDQKWEISNPELVVRNYLGKGYAPNDYWMIDIVNQVAKERQDYPTQKPEALLEKIIKASSNDGDIILDCFAGSGTTGVVSEKLNRRWIMVDSGKLAIYTMQKRLMELKEEIGNNGKSLKHKPFVLYNAGLYYNEKLVKGMQDHQYKDFVLELFGCQKRDHKINGLQMHGTLNNHSVMVFDKKDYLTYVFIDDLHKVVGSSIKDNLYIIAPAGIVGFAEDYVVKEKERYTVLRIPNSIIEYIKEKNFSRIQQPRSASDINQTIDSVGFDFIYPPNVVSRYYAEKPQDKLIDTQYVIEIENFEPIQLGSKIVEFDDPKSESLAMVMIDTDHDGDVFKLEKYLFGDEISKNNFKITLDEEIGNMVMIIYLDIFGNEKREILSKTDFESG